MRYLIVLIALYVLLPLSAQAADYTITLTAEQDERLQRYIEKLNDDRAALTPPLPDLTILEYLRHLIVDGLPSFPPQRTQEWRLERLSTNLVQRWPSLTVAEKLAICAQLGARAGRCPE